MSVDKISKHCYPFTLSCDTVCVLFLYSKNVSSFYSIPRKESRGTVHFLYVFPFLVSLFIMYLIQINDSAEKVCCHVCVTYLVSSKGSQSTWYALIEPHISECWPENGLIRPKYVATITYNILIFINPCCVLMVTLKHFILLLNPFRFNYSSLDCNTLILGKISKGNIIIWHSMLCRVMKRASFCTQGTILVHSLNMIITYISSVLHYRIWEWLMLTS
jgi:hypothetical protein